MKIFKFLQENPNSFVPRVTSTPTACQALNSRGYPCNEFSASAVKFTFLGLLYKFYSNNDEIINIFTREILSNPQYRGKLTQEIIPDLETAKNIAEYLSI